MKTPLLRRLLGWGGDIGLEYENVVRMRQRRCAHEFTEQHRQPVKVQGRLGTVVSGVCARCGTTEYIETVWDDPEPPAPSEWVGVRFTRQEADTVLRLLPGWCSGLDGATLKDIRWKLEQELAR